MNEEEKKVVERIEGAFYSDLGKGINKFQKITLYEDAIRDVRILLNSLEKLQKENEELREINEELSENKLLQDIEIKKNYIPIQRIIDKIEELKKDETNKYYYMFLEDRDLENTIQVLQELLEK